jgi:hypothetical protein
MRQYNDILRDIEKNMVDQQFSKELVYLRDWQKTFTTETELCSGTATWLYTFQVYSNCDEPLIDLIDEFGSYCKASGIHFV